VPQVNLEEPHAKAPESYDTRDLRNDKLEQYTFNGGKPTGEMNCQNVARDLALYVSNEGVSYFLQADQRPNSVAPVFER